MLTRIFGTRFCWCRVDVLHKYFSYSRTTELSRQRSGAPSQRHESISFWSTVLESEVQESTRHAVDRVRQSEAFACESGENGGQDVVRRDGDTNVSVRLQLCDISAAILVLTVRQCRRLGWYMQAEPYDQHALKAWLALYRDRHVQLSATVNVSATLSCKLSTPPYIESQLSTGLTNADSHCASRATAKFESSTFHLDQPIHRSNACRP